MIVQKAEKLVSQLETKKQIADNLNVIQLFQTRKSEIEGLFNKLNPIVATFCLFKAKGIGNVPLDSNAVTALKVVINLHERFKLNPESICVARSTNQLRTSIQSMCEVLDKNLSAVWEQFIQNSLPVINDDLLNVLARIPVFNDIVSKVRQYLREIDGMRRVLPKTEKDIGDFKQKIESIKSAWEKFGDNEAPTSVQTFLRKTAISGAELELLTPEVVNWLDKHGIQSYFKIKLST